MCVCCRQLLQMYLSCACVVTPAKQMPSCRVLCIKQNIVGHGCRYCQTARANSRQQHSVNQKCWSVYTYDSPVTQMIKPKLSAGHACWSQDHSCTAAHHYRQQIWNI